ncbi:MAG: hypothetical protein B6I20_01970 [Bacteroidetes bacterium 4572_117]|nr:MAG: hypothetical protein B6I20_01970 [Bacteroidetes bacterium 4572_117]
MVNHVRDFGILLFALFFFAQLNAQVNFVGGRAMGVSNASVTYYDNWAQFNNQAGLANINEITFGAGFQNAYFIKELGTNALAIALPTKTGVFGVNYSYFGYPKFNQNKFSLAFAKKLGKRISAGIQINYLYTHIEGEYGSQGLASGEIGIITEPINDFFIGAHVSNFWMAKYVNADEIRLPMIFKMGASYILYKKAILSAEIQKDVELPIIFKSGLEFSIEEKFFLRFGIASNPMIFSFGFGYKLKPFNVDISFSKHPVLGYSPAVSLEYAIKKKG